MPTQQTHWNQGTARPLRRYLFCLLVGFLVFRRSAILKADTLTLNSGEVLEGRILSETDTQIEIEASFYHGTIFSTRQVDKSDIRSIVRESLEQKQEKAAYASLVQYTLNPTQELTKEQYAAGITALEQFQGKYTNSTHAAEVSKHLADWQAEASNVASGKVKFAGAWMTPEEKKTQAEHSQKQAEADAAQNALQSLKSQLADLQVQRAQLGATIAATQSKLAAAQATGGSTPQTAASSGGGGLAARLTVRVTTPRPEETEANQGAPANPGNSQSQSDVASYQQQLGQEQAALAALDAKTKDIQSQIPQREQDSKLALARLAEPAVKPGVAQDQPKKQQPPPPPEPTPPWYTRLWNWFHK